MIPALAALLMTWATGWLAISCLWPGVSSFGFRSVLRGVVAAGIGLFISSAVYLACLALGIAERPGVVALDLIVLAGLGFLARRHRPPLERAPVTEANPDGSDRASTLDVVLGMGLVVALLFMGWAWWVRFRAEPMGFWDAFAIWNLKARFFFLESGEHWRRAFAESIDWSHTDYPLLLPLNVARLWTYAGTADQMGPALLSVVFVGLVMALLFGAIASIRGRAFAFLAVFALLATPAFARQATWQMADIPLSFFLASALALVVTSLRQKDEESEAAGRLLLLAGLMAGAAAWTKNEGLLFSLAIPVVLARVGGGSGLIDRGRRVWPFAAGLVAPLALLSIFKLGVGGASDLASEFEVASLMRVFEFARHREIVSSFASALLGVAGWPLLGVLAGLSGWSIYVGRRDETRSVELVALVLGLQLAGYYFIYLITERDLAWHLATSNLRLFTQLWPSVLLLLFLSLPPRDRANAPS